MRISIDMVQIMRVEGAQRLTVEYNSTPVQSILGFYFG
jgi:hypothetical protein